MSGRMEEATSACSTRTRTRAARSHLRSREAEALNALGDIYAFSGRFLNPLPLTRRLSTSRGHWGIERARLAARFNQGYAEADLAGSPTRRHPMRRRSRSGRCYGDRRGQAATLTALGHLYVIVGENEGALAQYRQASAWPSHGRSHSFSEDTGRARAPYTSSWENQPRESTTTAEARPVPGSEILQR